jgi:hypothetical protein
MPGGMLSLSANGHSVGSGVLWATLKTVPDYYAPVGTPTRDYLLAYDAQALRLLWQDVLPASPKWAVPTIADGKVLIGSASGTHTFSIYQLPLGAPGAVRASASTATSQIDVTWAADDPGTNSFDVEVQGVPGTKTIARTVHSITLPAEPGGFNTQIRVCAHSLIESACSDWVHPMDTTMTTWLDISKAELDQTGWGFADINNVDWARASRAAFAFCTANGFVAGELNGYQAVDSYGVLSRAGVICYTTGAKFFDSTTRDRAGSPWNFADVDKVQWSVASRLAFDFCQARGYAGGQFNGNQRTTAGDEVLMGIVCQAGQFYNADQSTEMITFSDVNTAPWAAAARAAYEVCRQGPPFLLSPSGTHASFLTNAIHRMNRAMSSEGSFPLGGRFNGNQGRASGNSTKVIFGTVCFQ